jgi:hypothetical protein
VLYYDYVEYRVPVKIVTRNISVRCQVELFVTPWTTLKGWTKLWSVALIRSILATGCGVYLHIDEINVCRHNATW